MFRRRKGLKKMEMNIVIDKKIVADLKSWFDNYVSTFNCTDKELQRNIVIKKEHTERVTHEIINIGRELRLNDSELSLAEIIALFHDIGRFEQYDRYRTFSDHKSENHAELGIEILKRNDVLGMLEDAVQKLIFCSIKYHNYISLPSAETETCLFYARLIRDADKLDILNVVTGYYHRKNGKRNTALELELPETPGISREVYKALVNRKIVNMKHVRNINDIKLLQAGWIYDINFKPTFDLIAKRGYMESLRDSLPDTAEIKEIFKIIMAYIEIHDGCPSNSE